ncbi:MAG: alpha/beta hydrolase [Chitinophagaceae bacterium]
MEQTIYCISGLGADQRIFTNLHLTGYKLRHIQWIRPEKRETMQAYALKMAGIIEEDNAVLIGVSFGGMMGIEIAKLKPLRKLILVSSIKSVAELPYWMKLSGKLKLNKIIPVRPLRAMEKIANDRLGASNEEEKRIARAYRQAADPVYVEWAVNHVVNWKNNWQPDHIIHIHGDKDKMFPIKKITNSHIIKDGTHFMIYNRAAEISEIILQELKQ